MPNIQVEIRVTHLFRDVARELGTFTTSEIRKESLRRQPGLCTQVRNNLGSWILRRLRDGSVRIVEEKFYKNTYAWITSTETTASFKQRTKKVEVQEVLSTIEAPKEQEKSVVEIATDNFIGAVTDLMGVMMLESLKKVKGELAAEMERKLVGVRLESLEELAANLPQHPRIYNVIQEAKVPRRAPMKVPNVHANGTSVEYRSAFKIAFNAITDEEREGVSKGLGLLIHNGPTYQSLQTKRLLQTLPDVPTDGQAWLSRSGVFRFAWGREGKQITIFTLFRRGETGYIDSER